MQDSVLFYAIIAILIFQYLLETTLSILNARHFDDPIPEELADVFDPEAYKKSQAYKRVNHKFGMFTSIFSLVLVLAFLIFGGFEWADGLARSVTEHPVWQSLLFFGIILVLNDIVQMPFSYYHTFVIEERFGFNKSTRLLFVTDRIKSWLMLALLGGGIMAAVIWLYEMAGPDFWIYAWIIIAVFTLFVNLFYSRLIVPIFNKQTPLEEGELKTKIEAYAEKVGFRIRNIFVIDGSKRSTKANAYFSGFGREKRVTLYDTLINDLEAEEVVAVLAHEVGHYKRKHIPANLAASILLTGLTLFLLSIFVNNPEVSYAIGVSTPSFHAALVSFGLLYSPISEATGLLMNLLSRKFEYQADEWAKKTFGAEPLITSLKKLSRHSLSNLTPHPAYVFLHYSHPPLIRRLRKLKA